VSQCALFCISGKGEVALTYRQRLSLLIIIDSFIVLTAIFFSRFLLDASLDVFTIPIVISSITLLVSHHFFSFYYKLYKKAWEYASVGELLIISKAVSLSIMSAGVIQQIIVQDVYFRLLAITWMIHMLLIGGSRICWRIFRGRYSKNSGLRKRTLILGAGSAGTMLVRQLLNNSDTELLPVAFVDDDSNKHNLDIMGIPVIGGISSIERIAREHKVDNIVIAIPSLNKKQLNTIFTECAKTKAKTQIIPMLEDLATGKISVNH
jgi:FlaA1/EpsC-like NDP-sugar epimerase